MTRDVIEETYPGLQDRLALQEARRGPLFERMDDLAVTWEDRQPPWLVYGLAYSGGVTLLSGPPKKGKSTLLAQLALARQTGDSFLDRQTRVGPTLLLSEEGGYPVVYRWHRARDLIVMQRHVAIQHYQSVPPGASMLDWVMGEVKEWCEAESRPMVIVDTLAVWAGIEDENDASQATKAVAAWTNLAETTNAAVVLVHHTRKSGGTGGEAIRGSSAILATVGISVELRTVAEGSDDRSLAIEGRVILPEMVRLAYDRETATYSIGEAGPDLGQIEDWLAICSPDGDGRSVGDLTSLWEVGRTTAQRRITTLLDKGRMRRSEVMTGRRAAWRHWAIPAVPGRVYSTTPGAEDED